MDSNPDSDHLSHVDCDPDSNPDSGTWCSCKRGYSLFLFMLLQLQTKDNNVAKYIYKPAFST